MSDKFDLYKEITDKVLAAMEQGIIPWRKPWAIPTGAVSHYNGKPYSFLNQILLSLSAADQQRSENSEYVTFMQIKAEGGKIKKGEKASMVVFWKMYQKECENEDGEKQIRQIPVLRYYHVFEVSQCEGIKRKYPIEAASTTGLAPVDEAERVVADYFARETCKLRIGQSSSACYSPTLDVVNVPEMSQYEAVGAYYSTLFHEMTHSTGHRSRLDRLEKTNFGSDAYSKEELVAELGAVYLCNQCGLNPEEHFDNSVAYLQSWSSRLKEDISLFVSAASKAERAVAYINGNKGGDNE